MHESALQFLVEHINNIKEASQDTPVFVMTKLARLYEEQLEKAGVTGTAHASRLKEKLLNACPFLESCGTAGQASLLTFKKDIATSLKINRALSSGDFAILDKAADLLRRDIFSHKSLDWQNVCAESVASCVPASLNYFSKRLLDGPSSPAESDQAVSTLSQITMCHARKNPKGNVRHRHVSRETPLPVYLAAKIYGATRSKTLVDTAYAVGVSISYDYDRLKTILSERANRACHFYRQEGLICPARLELGAFTTAAVDNLDHNTSSTTAKAAFHGNVISLMQHGPPGN